MILANLKNFGEFLKNDIEGKVIDLNNPTCANCNDCCSRGTVITEEEYKTIKKFLKTNEGKKIYSAAKKKIDKYKKQGTIYWICPFSNKNKKCSIYNIRPQICRDFHCSPKYNKVLERPDGSGFTINDLFKKGMN